MVTVPTFVTADFWVTHLGVPQNPTFITIAGGMYFLANPGWDGSETELQYVKGVNNVLDRFGRILQSFGPVPLPHP